jgi:hypothetical protein
MPSRHILACLMLGAIAGCGLLGHEGPGPDAVELRTERDTYRIDEAITLRTKNLSRDAVYLIDWDIGCYTGLQKEVDGEWVSLLWPTYCLSAVRTVPLSGRDVRIVHWEPEQIEALAGEPTGTYRFVRHWSPASPQGEVHFATSAPFQIVE